jgi:hypothetical protein
MTDNLTKINAIVKLQTHKKNPNCISLNELKIMYLSVLQQLGQHIFKHSEHQNLIDRHTINNNKEKEI